MSTRAERNTALAAVHDAVMAGAMVKDAAAAEGVNLSTYRLWRIREGFLTPRGPMPTAAQYESAEHEIRARLSNAQICAKHGLIRDANLVVEDSAYANAYELTDAGHHVLQTAVTGPAAHSILGEIEAEMAGAA